MVLVPLLSGMLAQGLGLGLGLASAQGAPKPLDSARLSASGSFFALSVPDLEESVRWYSEKLGLEVVLRPPRANQATVAVLEGNGLIVELIQHDDGRAPRGAAPGVLNQLLVHGFFKAGVIVENLDEVLAMLRSRNVPLAFGPFPAGNGQRANFAIRDNAGNLIQFIGR